MQEDKSSTASVNGPNRQLADQMYKQAVEKYQIGQYKEAEELCINVLQNFPKHINTINLYGAIAQTLNRPDVAAEQFKKAVSLKPGFAFAHSNLGIAYKKLGELDEAIQSYQKAISLKPDFPDAFSNLGNILQELGRLDEAISYCKKAIALKPDYADAYLNLGIAKQEQGKLNEAISCYQKAIALKPDFAEAIYGLGTIYCLSDLQRAESYIRQSIDFDPNCGLYGKREYLNAILLKKSLENKSDIKARLLVTMPRSGTFYCKYFFTYYDQLLSGNSELNFENSPQFYKPKAIDFDIFNVIHALCPGYDRDNEQFTHTYDYISYKKHGYGLGDKVLQVLDDEYSPNKNKNVRIVYLFRNPLDHAVSFFFHSRNHITAELRKYTQIKSGQSESDALKNYFFKYLLGCYIKQYTTFKMMSELYPQQIKMVHYEELKAYPNQTFSGILQHFDHDPSTPKRALALQKALKHTEIGEMKKTEAKNRHSLAIDQMSNNSSHIRSGKAGDWKQYFAKKDLQETEKILNQFDISLNDFILE
ncbi:MAG: tetratricopeptide repeat protein [Magnetococcales bacterium]|nr:tetratricopeptide repeat protein [Magnetococcales bacterium]